MKLIILSVIVVIGAILFFIGGETGKEVTRGLDINDSKDAGCAGCLGILVLIIFGIAFLFKVFFINLKTGYVIEIITKRCFKSDYVTA